MEPSLDPTPRSAFLFAVYGPVVVVRFEAPPTRHTAQLIIELTAAEAAKGHRLTFVGVVADRLQTPSAEFREVLAAQGPTIRSHAASIHFIIEGTGFMARIQRAMLAALSSVVSMGVPFEIHRTGAQALAAVARERGIDLTSALADATRRGLFRA